MQIILAWSPSGLEWSVIAFCVFLAWSIASKKTPARMIGEMIGELKAGINGGVQSVKKEEVIQVNEVAVSGVGEEKTKNSLLKTVTMVSLAISIAATILTAEKNNSIEARVAVFVSNFIGWFVVIGVIIAVYKALCKVVERSEKKSEIIQVKESEPINSSEEKPAKNSLLKKVVIISFIIATLAIILKPEKAPEYNAMAFAATFIGWFVIIGVAIAVYKALCK